MSNTFDKLSVLDSFLEEVNSYLPEIETNIERLAQSPGDMDALEETYRRTHTIGGSASMMDFPGLAHVAHGMEDILGDALDGLISLDEPALGLLLRSLGRLHQLLEGIRNGIDEESVIAEDDADYTRYRDSAILKSASQTTPAPEFTPVAIDSSRQGFTVPASEIFDKPMPVSSSMPSFDEVLESFRTPSLRPGEDVVWPEEPESSPTAPFEALRSSQSVPPSVESWRVPEMPLSGSTSALDALVASVRQSPPPEAPEPISYSQPLLSSQPVIAEEESYSSYPAANLAPSSQDMFVPEMSFWDTQLSAREQEFPQAYNEMQRSAQHLESQASSLKNLVMQLRVAVTVIENQRSEFKDFLNGSKDALDRMEDWAGQAMGLNLRNSPEQVRRYLPLSVMWVANSKLKKVLDLLTQVTGGVEVTDEQLGQAFQQLHSSVDVCGQAFQQLQSEHEKLLTQEAGWSPWEMRTSQEPEAVRERVTFERQGDLSALRAEIEAGLRDELQKEYEAQPISMAMRAELEQQIRIEVRQEFEERRRLQERVLGVGDTQALQDLEAQLRGDIEIQVRQEFLDQLTKTGGNPSFVLGISPTAQPSTPSETNYLDRAPETTVFPPAVLPSPPQPSLPATATPPVSVSRPLSSPPSSKKPETSKVSAFSGDFGEEAAEIFRLEAEEHLQTVSVHTAALEKDPTNREITQAIRRATHTLKGAAGMMGFRAIADLCHIFEDLLDSIMDGETAIDSAVLSIILDTAETLDTLISGRDSDPASDEEKVRTLQTRYIELLGERNTTAPIHEEELLDTDDHSVDTGLLTGVVAGDQAGDNTARRSSQNELSVRVRLQKLDELVNLFGELLVNRSILEERIQRLVRLVSDVGVSSNRLHDVGQKLESRFEAATLPSGRSVQVMPGEGNQGLTLGTSSIHTSKSDEHVPSHLAQFHELELDRYTEFHQLARGLSEGISDMTTLSMEMDTAIRECEGVFARESRLSTTFQDRLMKARLVPLSTMVPRLYRTARSVALKQGKEFDFLLEGETTEVDRTVYEEIAGPLLHLIRNAVNHAIETPETRIQKGKSPTGQIKLSAAYEGNQIVITVRDDGTGLDREHVRQVAIARGLIRPDQMLTEHDLLSLIFLPGFSTAEVLSEESGRGVGLDVVRDSVSRLRGTLAVESMPGQGTAFTMTFPTSLAIQNAMMVRIGGQQFAIPTVNVESIGRLDNFKRTTLGGQPAVVVHNEYYPLTMLAHYLSLPAGAIEDKAQLLFVNTGGHRVALVVEEIKGRFDIVMKNLGRHLRDVHGIAGATVLGNGRVVLVLELNSLLSPTASNAPKLSMPALKTRNDAIVSPVASGSVKQHIDLSTFKQSTGVARPAASTPPTPERGKHLLVVDDSPSVRRVVSNMLKQHNWEVQMARDGVEALEMISYETPAAVLLDIEMPRMDGYELISTVRAQEQYRTLPLIVLTSRAAAKHQRQAMMLGASAYVVKPYQDEELLSTINDLVFSTTTR